MERKWGGVVGRRWEAGIEEERGGKRKREGGGRGGGGGGIKK